MILPFFDKLDDASYHAYPALSSSGIKHLLKSPAHYLASLQVPREPTPSMEFGTLFHMSILEPMLFEDKVMPMPELNLRTKDGKAQKAELESTGKKLVDAKTFDKIRKMQKSIFNNWIADTYLLDTRLMKEYTLITDLDGKHHKAKPDGILPSQRTVIDVKTVADASEYKFQNAILNFGYHIQAAHYLNVCRRLGLEVDNFVFIAVETEPPYTCAVFDLSAEFLDYGHKLCEKAYKIYKELPEDFFSQSFDALPSSQNLVKTIDLPNFLKGESL